MKKQKTNAIKVFKDFNYQKLIFIDYLLDIKKDQVVILEGNDDITKILEKKVKKRIEVKNATGFIAKNSNLDLLKTIFNNLENFVCNDEYILVSSVSEKIKFDEVSFLNDVLKSLKLKCDFDDRDKIRNYCKTEDKVLNFDVDSCKKNDRTKYRLKIIKEIDNFFSMMNNFEIIYKNLNLQQLTEHLEEKLNVLFHNEYNSEALEDLFVGSIDREINKADIEVRIDFKKFEEIKSYIKKNMQFIRIQSDVLKIKDNIYSKQLMLIDEVEEEDDKISLIHYEYALSLTNRLETQIMMQDSATKMQKTYENIRSKYCENDENLKKVRGKDLYHYLIKNTSNHNYIEHIVFYVSGLLHYYSNKKIIGWHQDYKEILDDNIE